MPTKTNNCIQQQTYGMIQIYIYVNTQCIKVQKFLEVPTKTKKYTCIITLWHDLEINMQIINVYMKHIKSHSKQCYGQILNTSPKQHNHNYQKVPIFQDFMFTRTNSTQTQYVRTLFMNIRIMSTLPQSIKIISQLQGVLTPK